MTHRIRPFVAPRCKVLREQREAAARWKRAQFGYGNQFNAQANPYLLAAVGAAGGGGQLNEAALGYLGSTQ